MLIEIKVPVFAESVTEATLVTWNKKQGEFVRRNENLVDMETDKVMLEIVAPRDGVLKDIIKADGAKVSSNDVIAVIDTEAAEVRQAASAAEPPHLAAVKNIREASVKTAPPAAAPAEVRHQSRSGANLSPAVRKMVADNQLDPQLIKGSGKEGRIVKGDVLEYLEHIQPVPAEEQIEPATAYTPVRSVPEQMPSRVEEERLEKRVPMTRLRQRIAERLKEAQNTAAILTTFNEINMKPVMDLRERYKDKFLERHKVKLGFMSFFTKAVVEALKQFPIINAATDGNDIIYHGYYDIGIAVGTPRGLVVPVLRNVDNMSFADVEIAIQDYGMRAREGKLSLEELTGGTFSISNGGVYGSMLSTPILNPPQSAILGMHNIVERPVVENGEIVIRPMMYVALSYDHRIIDGHDAVLFLVAVKQLIEDPTRILLDI
ncbi:MAG: 2-oxoglutarate dehydrogenase complex dihydrolipoyllysine-residue succinyltransferase [Gammaproteobacteria bacterium]|nr:2-oxoglutarate dehydrogenase complex dihydrolipoyllysine-residue succinyltransferase [Gammaproteobacteria bacterium]